MNIDFEKKFIDLMGFTIVMVSSNRWNVFDENGYVGYIEFRKLRENDESYGFHTEIENSKIKFINDRLINTDNILDQNYAFLVKDEFGNVSSVDMALDGLVRINIWNEKNGFITFNLNKSTLYFSYRSSLDNFNIEETIKIQVSDKDKWFGYTLNYTDNNHDIYYGDGFVKTKTIDFKSDEYMDPGLLKVEMRSIENSEIVNEDITYVNATLADAIAKQEIAIISFNYLRELLKNILPFKEDIISYLVSIVGVERKELLTILDNTIARKRTLK